jgi:hypothetical protein
MLVARRKGHGARSTELRAEHLEKAVSVVVIRGCVWVPSRGNVLPVMFLTGLDVLTILICKKT